jgi:hypothetical protein
MFGMQSSISQSQLMTINLATGACTPIGPVSTVSPGAISLSCTSNGTLFSIDIVTDQLHRWNKITGVATVVGPLGFDANYGQDTQFDQTDDVLYGAVFNNAAFAPELRVIDTLTGAATFIGTYANTIQVQTIAIRPACAATTFSQTLTGCAPFAVTVGTNTYTATGTYTDVLVNAQGCDSTVTTNLTVNALPTVGASATASVICAGDSVTVMGSGADTYTWTAGVNDMVAFAPTATDTYTVTGVDLNGCSNTASVMVTVNALPAVGASATATTICAGDSVTVMGSGADTYTWTAGVNDMVAFAPTSTDTYTVTGTDVNGCMDTASVMITVNALPTVTVSLSNDTACSGFGNMITLDGESPMGGTWSGNGVNGNMFNVDSVGIGMAMITYTYTDPNGCTAMTMDSIMVDLCMTVTENAAGNVSLYPNPTNGEFTVQLNGSTTATVEIMNELGQVVTSFNMTSSVRTVDMKNFESGVYFIRVMEGNATTTHRLIKH